LTKKLPQKNHQGKIATNCHKLPQIAANCRKLPQIAANCRKKIVGVDVVKIWPINRSINWGCRLIGGQSINWLINRRSINRGSINGLFLKVDQSLVDQSGVDQSGVDQSSVDH
jgi:hypothetical protein